MSIIGVCCRIGSAVAVICTATAESVRADESGSQASGLKVVHAQFSTAPGEVYAQRHILVKFKAEALPLVATNSLAAALARLASGFALPSGARLEEPQVSRLLRLELAGKAATLSNSSPATAAVSLDLDRFLYLHLPPGLSVADAVEQVSAHPLVEYAEPDGLGTAGVVPSDPAFSQQWFHTNLSRPGADIHSTPAWDITQGSSNTVVAVLDSGLGAGVAEFAGRVVPGYNFAYTNSNTADDNGHGTAVAGVLCANANNNLLGAGVDWRCRIMPIKVLDSGNSGYYSWWAQGIDYAVSHGAKVINLSAGGTTSDLTLTASISNAIARGVIFVTITHNDGTGIIRFPGNLPMCITVGATDQNDQRCSFSNYGPQIDLVAPGTNIYTVGMSGGGEVWWGTSFAAPQVAGVCSLLSALQPGLNQDQARALVCAGAQDGVGGPDDTLGFDLYYGWGRLNAYNSLVLAQTHIDQVQPQGRALVLSWSSPPNASNRLPFRVATAATPSGPWTLDTNTALFGFTPTRTYWTNSNPGAPPSFYRVQIWQP